MRLTADCARPWKAEKSKNTAQRNSLSLDKGSPHTGSAGKHAPPWPHPQPVAARSRGTRNRRQCHSRLSLLLLYLAYLARFQTTVAVLPPDAVGTVYASSSPVTVKARFCSVPSQLGNVAVSILKVKVLSAALTDMVPKWVRLPPTIALFSSAVAVVRLLEATLGRSAREKAIT